MRRVILISIFFLFFFSSQVSATTIFSPLVELEVEPGQTQMGLVKVFNETDENLYLVSSVESFDINEETDKISYSLLKEDSFLEWFKVSQDSIIVLPKQVVIIPFEVTAPAQATPGGYYSVIFWQTVSEPGQEVAPVNVSGKVGTLVFLKVKGDLIEQGEVAEFKTEPAGNYFFGLPINFKIGFLNSGNIHLEPKGTVELKNWLGQTKILEVNTQKRFVLPGKTKQFELVWGGSHDNSNIWQNFWDDLKMELDYLAFGKVKATLHLNYGAEEEKEIIKYLDFWFIPKNLLIFLAGVIIILVILFKINIRVKKLKNVKKK